MKLVKNKSGTYSAHYIGEGGIRRSTNLKTKTLAEAKKIAKSSGIENMETLAKIGAITADSVNKIVAGQGISIGKTIREWQEYLAISAKSMHGGHTAMCNIKKMLRDNGLTEQNKLSDIQVKHIDKFVNTKDDIKAGSRELRRSSIAGLFKFALIRGYIFRNIVDEVQIDLSKLTHEQKETKEVRAFTEAQFERLVREVRNGIFPERDYFADLAIIAWWTGLRLGDICCLEWAGVKETELIVWTEKRDKRVKIPIQEPLYGSGIVYETLSNLEMMDATYVWPKLKAERDSVNTKSNQSAFFARDLCERRLGERLELEEFIGLSFHCFRHSFIQRLNRSGVPMEKIKKIVGHTSSRTTEGYLACAA
jgi:integrase